MLQRILKDRKPYHIDCVILEALNNNCPGSEYCSYVVPPIGGYSGQHQSMNVASSRPAPWQEKWSQGGTNPFNATDGKQWPEQHALAVFGRKGPLEPLMKLSLTPTGAAPFWKTRRPPGGPFEPDIRRRTAQRMRGWITEKEAARWLGPFFQSRPPWWQQPHWKGRPKGGAARPPTTEEILQILPPEDYWKNLQYDPCGPPSLGGQTAVDCPISALAWELACHPDRDPEHLQHNERAARMYRFARLLYCKRYFVLERGQVLWGRLFPGVPPPFSEPVANPMYPSHQT